MDLKDTKKNIEYFSSWQLQNKITLISLLAILFLSAVFAVACMVLPEISTFQMISFIVLFPAMTCFGIATSHSSKLEAQKAQREYEKLQQRLVETEGSQITLDRFFLISSDLMAVAGNDGLLKKVSTSLLNTLGYSEQTLLSTPFFKFIHPDDQESTRKNIENLNLGLRSVGFENRYRAADGNYRTLSWSAAADAELGIRFASARDVTDERDYKCRTQQVMDGVPWPVMVKDVDGVVTECNSAFVRFAGLPRESVVGRTVAELQISTNPEKENEVLKSQHPQTFEEVLSNQNGSAKYVSTIFPVFDRTGKIVSLGKVSLKISLG